MKVPYPFVDELPERARQQLYRNFEEIVTGTTGGGGIMPAGALMPFAGSVAPVGWLLCDGQAVSRTAYAALFAAIGTTYGAGDGSTTFNLPNVKGRIIVGQDTGQAEFATRGGIGGAKGHYHNVNVNTDTRDTNHAHNVVARNADTGANIQNHAHGFTTSEPSHGQVFTTQGHVHTGGSRQVSESPTAGGFGGGHWHTGNTGGVDTLHGHNFNHDHPSTNWQSESPWGAGGATHLHNINVNVGNVGSGQADANLAPYLVLNYLIRT